MGRCFSRSRGAAGTLVAVGRGQCHLLVNPPSFPTGFPTRPVELVFSWGLVCGSAPSPNTSPSILARAPGEGLLTLWVTLEGQKFLRKIEINEAEISTVPSTLAVCQGGEHVPAGQCPSVLVGSSHSGHLLSPAASAPKGLQGDSGDSSR